MLDGTVYAWHPLPKPEYTPVHIVCLVAAVKRTNELMEKLNS